VACPAAERLGSSTSLSFPTASSPAQVLHTAARRIHHHLPPSAPQTPHFCFHLSRTFLQLPPLLKLLPKHPPTPPIPAKPLRLCSSRAVASHRLDPKWLGGKGRAGHQHLRQRNLEKPQSANGGYRVVAAHGSEVRRTAGPVHQPRDASPGQRTGSAAAIPSETWERNVLGISAPLAAATDRTDHFKTPSGSEFYLASLPNDFTGERALLAQSPGAAAPAPNHPPAPSHAGSALFSRLNRVRRGGVGVPAPSGPLRGRAKPAPRDQLCTGAARGSAATALTPLTHAEPPSAAGH